MGSLSRGYGLYLHTVHPIGIGTMVTYMYFVEGGKSSDHLSKGGGGNNVQSCVHVCMTCKVPSENCHYFDVRIWSTRYMYTI